MKQSLSYVLPLAALLIIAVIGFRWVNNRPAPVGEVTENAEGIEISDITGDDTLPTGVVDRETVNLTPQAEMAQGKLRYNTLPDNRIQFSVQSDLPKPEHNEFYQLWFEGEKGPKKAVRMIDNKGGYFGQGIVSSEFETLKVIVSKETHDDNVIEEVMLEGDIELNEEIDLDMSAE